jgi:hypothetical protein
VVKCRETGEKGGSEPVEKGKKKKPGKKTAVILCVCGGLALIAAVLLLTDLRVRVVGRDIREKRIREFWYTYSTSTDPPHYQRYRFYTEDGSRFFYHETREGDHWPLRETDITVSGTRELTETEWEALLALLKGGTVEKRRETASSGGAGPWLYLYWQGDLGRWQVYSFPGREARGAFEAFCLELKG